MPTFVNLWSILVAVVMAVLARYSMSSSLFTGENGAVDDTHPDKKALFGSLGGFSLLVLSRFVVALALVYFLHYSGLDEFYGALFIWIGFVLPVFVDFGGLNSHKTNISLLVKYFIELVVMAGALSLF